jgi:hypothetical protein
VSVHPSLSFEGGNQTSPPSNDSHPTQISSGDVYVVMRSPIHGCLLMLALIPGSAVACKLIAGHQYDVPTEKQLVTGADAVFIGKVIRLERATELSSVTQHPETYLLTMQVTQWEKSSGAMIVEVVDTTGSNCDGTFGTTHIAMAAADDLKLEWRVFARKSSGRLVLLTARRLP